MDSVSWVVPSQASGLSQSVAVDLRLLGHSDSCDSTELHGVARECQDECLGKLRRHLTSSSHHSDLTEEGVDKLLKVGLSDMQYDLEVPLSVCEHVAANLR